MVTTGGAFFFFDLEAAARGDIEEVTGGIGSAGPGAGGRRVVTGGTVSASTKSLESCGAGIGALSDCTAETESLGGCAAGTVAVDSAGGFVGAATVVFVGAAMDTAGGFVAGCVKVAAIGLVTSEVVISCVGVGAVGCVVPAEGADATGAAAVGCADDSEASGLAGAGSLVKAVTCVGAGSALG
jgi:hypothetical protein